MARYAHKDEAIIRLVSDISFACALVTTLSIIQTYKIILNYRDI